MVLDAVLLTRQINEETARVVVVTRVDANLQEQDHILCQCGSMCIYPAPVGGDLHHRSRFECPPLPPSPPPP
eukprot:CAMPEP_0174731448 /NCGR_PEP_ID=MMETSP1094-20130205/57571_1 /TAXON_ID=156173 /ORGANISM="Chrysochromulina brevifilum, Strain UTEX LB 985" /LENGTH=71 /DNA_ID=CAMNT_0015933829 /DNA_START=353 /DNA_END=564 /DNA_ORIENTATION=+